MKPRLIVFDFDGVICDSVKECLFSSYNAYQKIKKRKIRIKGLNEIPVSTRKNFYAMRPFVRSGEDYIVMHTWIEEGKVASNQKDFDAIRIGYESKFPAFKKALYDERDRLMEQNKLKWLSLNPLFPVIKNELNRLDPSRIAILSTKRKKDVQEILKHHNITVAENRIMHASASEKIKNLLKVIHRHNVNLKKIIFLEDQVEYLISAKEIGIKGYLVSWGYHSDVERQRAMEFNIPILEPHQLKKRL